MFSLAEFSDKNIVITVKGFKPATSSVRDKDAKCQQDMYVRDRIFKFSLIHASVIYQITSIR